jgi:hypothetical protein
MENVMEEIKKYHLNWKQCENGIQDNSLPKLE